METINTLVVEAVIVGLIFSILLVLVSMFISPNNINNQVICGFIAGAVGHFGFEYMGINKWYCKNGNACKSN